MYAYGGNEKEHALDLHRNENAIMCRKRCPEVRKATLQYGFGGRCISGLIIIIIQFIGAIYETMRNIINSESVYVTFVH